MLQNIQPMPPPCGTLSSLPAVPITERGHRGENPGPAVHCPPTTFPSPNDNKEPPAKQPRNSRIQIKARRVFLQAACLVFSLEGPCSVVISIWPLCRLVSLWQVAPTLQNLGG